MEKTTQPPFEPPRCLGEVFDHFIVESRLIYSTMFWKALNRSIGRLSYPVETEFDSKSSEPSSKSSLLLKASQHCKITCVNQALRQCLNPDIYVIRGQHSCIFQLKSGHPQFSCVANMLFAWLLRTDSIPADLSLHTHHTTVSAKLTIPCRN